MGASFTVINLIALIATLTVFIMSLLLLTKRGKVDSIFLTVGSLMEVGRSVFFAFLYRAIVRSGSYKVAEAVSWIGSLGYLIFVTGFVLLVVNLTTTTNMNRPKY